MKKALYLLLLMALLTGCASQNGVDEAGTDNRDTTLETSITTELSSNPEDELSPSLQAYIAVLENKTPLYNSYSKKEMYLDETVVIAEGERIEKFSIIDLNDDGSPEVVLRLYYMTNEDYAFSVLHYEDGIVYQYGFPYRGFNDLKVDGSFYWSNSAFNSGIAKLDFHKDEYIETNLAYCDVDTEENYSYYIGDKSVSHAEFSAFQDEHGKTQSVEWHDYSIEDFKSSVANS